MTLLALETDETLLILKIAFLVLLYVFILRVVRSATKGMQQAPAGEHRPRRRRGGGAPSRARPEARAPARRHRARSSHEGSTIEIAAPTVVGRDAQSDIRLDRDEFASGRHARIEPRPDGVWVDDLGSTNGTFVNGEKLKRATARQGRRRDPDRRDRAAGAVVRIGRSTAVTDTGRRRRRNEDAYVCEPPLFAIADGMGGAQAGEVASGIAAAALKDGRRTVAGEESLDAIIHEANRRVYERSVADPSTAGMGTTMTVGARRRRRARSSSATSATRARTGCATTSSSR